MSVDYISHYLKFHLKHSRLFDAFKSLDFKLGQHWAILIMCNPTGFPSPLEVKELIRGWSTDCALYSFINQMSSLYLSKWIQLNYVGCYWIGLFFCFLAFTFGEPTNRDKREKIQHCANEFVAQVCWLTDSGCTRYIDCVFDISIVVNHLKSTVNKWVKAWYCSHSNWINTLA